MKFLRHAPIKRKVLIVTLLGSSLGLFLTGGVLLLYQYYNFSQRFPAAFAADGIIMASHTVAALALQDRPAAQLMLAAIKAKPHISEAQLRLPDGTLFAREGNKTAPVWEPGPGLGLQRIGPYLVYSELLIMEQEDVGVLHLRADYDAEVNSLLRVYASVLGPVLLLSIGLIALLSTRLQRVISEPILSLALTAKTIAARKDYTLRASKLDDDEIGQFTDAFNEMLAEIQSRDMALDLSRNKFETLINTIEGVVWEADPATLQFCFVSAQSQRLFGLAPAGWTDERRFWTVYIHPDDRTTVVDQLKRAVQDRTPCAQEYRLCIPGQAERWVRSHAHIVVADGQATSLRGVMLDITREKKAAEELAGVHAKLREASRFSGMAEVATGVLHNVGNVLNSVNVSVTIACDRIRKSEVTMLPKLSDLLRKNEARIGEYIAQDPTGRLIPTFVHQLSVRVMEERVETLQELELLAKNIGHIKEIVAMQQSYAGVSGVIEALSPSELINDALQLNDDGPKRRGVEVIKRIGDVPSVAVDRHKVLQILVNLLRNANQAIDNTEATKGQIIISAERNGSDTIQISVTDTGIGIPSENLTKIFSHGFTTKKKGHGFGLHSGANAAKEMGGNLVAASAGLGRGSTFTLELPAAKSLPS